MTSYRELRQKKKNKNKNKLVFLFFVLNRQNLLKQLYQNKKLIFN